jgi:hypothetical protein
MIAQLLGKSWNSRRTLAISSSRFGRLSRLHAGMLDSFKTPAPRVDGPVTIESAFSGQPCAKIGPFVRAGCWVTARD